jgi:ribosomal protein L28
MPCWREAGAEGEGWEGRKGHLALCKGPARMEIHHHGQGTAFPSKGFFCSFFHTWTYILHTVTSRVWVCTDVFRKTYSIYYTHTHVIIRENLHTLAVSIAKHNTTTTFIPRLKNRHIYVGVTSVTSRVWVCTDVFRKTYSTVSAKKNARIENFVTELCQFVGGGWKVIFDVKQHSQPLLIVRNRGGELI